MLFANKRLFSPIFIGRLLLTSNFPSGFAGKSRTFAHTCINHPTYREVAKLLLKEEQ